jgi:hypothetical protein
MKQNTSVPGWIVILIPMLNATVQVSCGGCHTLVTAKPGLQNGTAAHSSSDEEDGTHLENGVLKSHSELTQAVIHQGGDFTGSFDLSGSISARNRRREKLPV